LLPDKSLRGQRDSRFLAAIFLPQKSSQLNENKKSHLAVAFLRLIYRIFLLDS